MTDTLRHDLSLTLLEASRFPGMQWKQLAVSCAEEAMRDLDDSYIHTCIAQRQSLLHRIGGNQEKAVRRIDDISGGRSQYQPDVNPRMHAAAGSTVIQRALNHFQNEELAAAIQALDTWQPLHHMPAEEVVVFRMDILRGRILRFQGQFQESVAHLERHAIGQHRDLIFDEDLPDLICELADVFRELDNSSDAERVLRTQLARPGMARTSATCLLKLSLAESLFGQGRYLESEELCSDVMSQQGLSKMGRLRLFITVAKLRHVDSDWDAAFEYWTQALKVVNTFPPTSGLATRTIYLSTSDILRHQSRAELAPVRPAVAILEQLSETSEAKHWIAGLRHWLAYLESRDE